MGLDPIEHDPEPRVLSFYLSILPMSSVCHPYPMLFQLLRQILHQAPFLVDQRMHIGASVPAVGLWLGSAGCRPSPEGTSSFLLRLEAERDLQVWRGEALSLEGCGCDLARHQGGMVFDQDQRGVRRGATFAERASLG